MNPADMDLDNMFKRLHLANARRIWRDLVVRAEKEQWNYRDLLAMLASEEVAQRQGTRLRRLSHQARFPFLKTIDDFDFTYQSSLRLQMLGSYLAPDFVTEGRSLVLSGKPGRGKTHLAVAIAYRAIQNGFDALFVTAAELIDELSAASLAGKLREGIAPYVRPAVLVCDEVGYLTYGTDAANVLFHVVNARYQKKRSMVFTTNKSLKLWGRVLHDEDLADAIVDRILHRGQLIKLDGPSVRTSHLELDSTPDDESQEPDRVSGMTPAEFPEPTAWTARHFAVCSSAGRSSCALRLRASWWRSTARRCVVRHERVGRIYTWSTRGCRTTSWRSGSLPPTSRATRSLRSPSCWSCWTCAGRW